MMPGVDGFRQRMSVLRNKRQLCLSTGVLRLAALAALLSCGIGPPVLATPLADVTSANEGPVETTASTRVDCCTRIAVLLKETAALRQSLSLLADSLAASEARADALAGKLLDSERTASSHQRECAALRSRLEAPPSLEASSRIHGSRTAPDAGRVPYPKTLPVIVAQHGNRWQVPIAELACTDSLYLQRRTLI
jgi:hypothetical protein